MIRTTPSSMCLLVVATSGSAATAGSCQQVLAPRSFLINAWTDCFETLPQPVRFEIMRETVLQISKGHDFVR